MTIENNPVMEEHFTMFARLQGHANELRVACKHADYDEVREACAKIQATANLLFVSRATRIEYLEVVDETEQ